MSNRTLTMVKPDAMKKGYAGAILDMMIKDGFRVVALKQLKLTPEKAGEFYAVHKARPFYGELVEFMSSGLTIVNVRLLIIIRCFCAAKLRESFGFIVYRFWFQQCFFSVEN